MGTAFLTQASNKRSIALDLKQERDREILKKLVATADVFVENYRPGAFEALGLGYEALSKINPRLIYASFSAFGQNGPRGEQTAYDHVIQATSGIMAMTGTKDVHPVKIGSPAVDYATGMTGAFALSAALFQRERTGKRPAHRHGDARRGDDPDELACSPAICATARIRSRTATAIRTPPTARSRPRTALVMLGASNLRQQRGCGRCSAAPR